MKEEREQGERDAERGKGDKKQINAMGIYVYIKGPLRKEDLKREEEWRKGNVKSG